MSTNPTVLKNRDEYEVYSHRMQFEHELINRRITWLLTSETILFAAYSFALENKESPFLEIVASVGLWISLSVFLGVIAAILAKLTLWRYFRRVPGNEKEPFWVHTGITFIGFVPDLVLPIVFALAWIALIEIY